MAHSSVDKERASRSNRFQFCNVYIMRTQTHQQQHTFVLVDRLEPFEHVDYEREHTTKFQIFIQITTANE